MAIAGKFLQCDIDIMIDVYESAISHDGRYGIVFERDDDTAYFYLLDLTKNEQNQLLEAFDAHIITTLSAEVSVKLEWNASDDAAGLFINGDLIAIFELRNETRKGRWANRGDKELFAFH